MAKADKSDDAAPQRGSEAPADGVRQVIIETCRAIATDADQPGAARVQAARTLAEMAGYIGKIQSAALFEAGGQEAEMSPEDIDRELSRLSSSRKRN